jgi:F-type H+-transporting ATPase subunit epsilon
MAEKLALKIVTPERQVIMEQVDDVILPSVDGYLGVLPGHAPLLAQLDVGEVSYLAGNQRHYLAVSGGFVEVLRESVSILATTCEKAEEIDLERARKSKERAENKLKPELPEEDFIRFEARLKRAVSRIQVKGRITS